MAFGRIIKTYSEFYYVLSGDRMYTCKARGLFKNTGIKPLVGDMVELNELADKDTNGNIIRVLDRHSVLKRPSVANVDLALAVFSSTRPKPNFSLADKCIIEFEGAGIPVVLCFNKLDEAENADIESIREIYKLSKVELIFCSAKTGLGLDKLKKLLKDKLTVLTGPSGVGKSSLVNALTGHTMSVGELSTKTMRGKQTTRHYELVGMDESSMLLDSPGFTSLRLEKQDYYSLKDSYSEMVELSAGCKFKNKCLHTCEPGCAVIEAKNTGRLSAVRYQSYLELMSELKK